MKLVSPVKSFLLWPLCRDVNNFAITEAVIGLGFVVKYNATKRSR